MGNTRLVSPWARCPECGHPIPVYAVHIVDYITDTPVVCSNCSRHLDWWKTVLREVEENFMYNQAFAFVGAQTVLFEVALRPGQRTLYKFSDHGISRDGKVLYVNYTPYTQGGKGLFPLEWHGNVPTRRFWSDEVVLYPAPLTDAQSLSETTVHVMVSWVPYAAADESWQNLLHAFEAYAVGRYASMIVPANVAVESSLLRLMTVYIDRFAGRKRTEEFLSNSATYGDQLNVLLPMVASLGSLPLLPDHIRGCLNRLRALRNDLAHAGVLEAPLDQHHAAELLCSALFGFHYVRYIHSRLFPTAAEDEGSET